MRDPEIDGLPDINGRPTFLTNDEKRICELLGVSEAEYAKTSDGRHHGGSGQKDALTSDEKRICRLLGVSEEEFIKARSNFAGFEIG